MDTIDRIRGDFPLLRRVINGYPLAYLDNAATSLKPQVVIDSLVDFYGNHGANIYRGVYTIAEESSTLFEKARLTVAQFIGAQPDEIIFTKGATEGINAVAATWASDTIKPGDHIIVSAMEHHANLVPWQECARKVGAVIDVIPVHSDGTLVMPAFLDLLSKRTKLVALCQVSNVLGTHNDVKSIIKFAHEVGARVLVDAAQSVSHQKIDVKELDADFLVFSGHKVMGPTGIGVLYAKQEILKVTRPYQYGGGMVTSVSLYETGWQEPPLRFEAGTPPIASAIGLAAALTYLQETINFEQLREHEASLCTHLVRGLSEYKRVKLYGPVGQLQELGHIVSFTMQGIHPHDIACCVDKYGICVRAGLQCAHPLIKALDSGPLVRVSTFVYNTHEEIDRFLHSLWLLMREMEDTTCFSGALF